MAKHPKERNAALINFFLGFLLDLFFFDIILELKIIKLFELLYKKVVHLLPLFICKLESWTH